MAGMFVAAVPLDCAIVYGFRDVDADQANDLNLAFRSLLSETIFFVIMTTAIFAICLSLVGFVWRPRKNVSKGQIRAFLSGFGLIVCQYVLSVVARKVFESSRMFEADLWIMLTVAPGICALLSAHNARQRNDMKVDG